MSLGPSFLPGGLEIIFVYDTLSPIKARKEGGEEGGYRRPLSQLLFLRRGGVFKLYISEKIVR